MVLNYY
ncbi:hypothetical protein VTH06DRAFT_7282 [Thermothelomyces fergusii]